MECLIKETIMFLMIEKVDKDMWNNLSKGACKSDFKNCWNSSLLSHSPGFIDMSFWLLYLKDQRLLTDIGEFSVVHCFHLGVSNQDLSTSQYCNQETDNWKLITEF